MQNILIRRSRIAKAEEKYTRAIDIIKRNFNEGEHWLVYCEDSDQLNDLNAKLRQSGFSPYIYKSDLGKAKEEELKNYVSKEGVLLSIKCLDEGVDIPKISHALILASSKNPRQFVSKKGTSLEKG